MLWRSYDQNPNEFTEETSASVSVYKKNIGSQIATEMCIPVHQTLHLKFIFFEETYFWKKMVLNIIMF